MSVTNDAAARELGAGLQRLRTEAGLTTRALGSKVSASHSNISNWEKGARLIPDERLTAILDVLGPEPDERERLTGLRRQAESQGELQAGASAIGPQLTQLITQEQTASEIIDVALATIPGLLQTSGYARSIFGSRPEADTLVALRMGRQEVLIRKNPVRLHALIDDEVLSRPIAPPDVMADQLRHLRKMMRLPNVTIQLIPSTAPGYSPHLAGGFLVLRYTTADPTVHLEHYRASVSVWDPAVVADFERAVELISERAMTPARTAEVIEELVLGLEEPDEQST